MAAERLAKQKEVAMAKPLVVKLTDEERTELERVRDTHPKPYMREHAAALLKIAEGHSGLQVAQHLLLRRRCQEAIYEWVERYRTEGIAGWIVRPGRGRKPLFSPSGIGRGR
jgi:hypothetical protein